MVKGKYLYTEHTWNWLLTTCRRVIRAQSVKWIRRPVSRVLCRPVARTRRPFLWTGPRGTVLATYPDPSDRRRSYPPSPRLGRARDPYSVLLLAGLAMPCLLPATRWALTPPFHPSPGKPGRFAFCGAVPGVAPGGRYPPPCRRGARTFLDPRKGRDRPAV